MRHKPRHLKKRSKENNEIITKTQQFSIPDEIFIGQKRQHGNFYYFFVTFLICIALFLLACAILMVDFRSRLISFGENDTTVAFSSTSEGIAEVQLLGREFQLDYRSVLPLWRAAARTGNYIGGKVPVSAKAEMKLLPEIFVELADKVASLFQMIAEAV